ncbi:MAG: hypothetical protein ACRCS9_07575 [Hyphomicrobium sp.]
MSDSSTLMGDAKERLDKYQVAGAPGRRTNFEHAGRDFIDFDQSFRDMWGTRLTLAAASMTHIRRLPPRPLSHPSAATNMAK